MSSNREPAKRFEVGQKAFIERDGRVLLVFRENGWLDFPGGRIEEGESDLIEALKREVREETTLEIEAGDPVATWLGLGDTVYLVGHRCRYVSGEVQLSDEHTDHRWVDVDTCREFDDGSVPYAVLRRFLET